MPDRAQDVSGPPQESGASRGPRRLSAFRAHFREWTVAGALAFLLLFLLGAAPGFYQSQPLLSLLTRESPTLVVACGMALVMICRHVDISVGSLFSVCGVVAGLLWSSRWPAPAVLLGAVTCGALGGAVNGALVAGLRLPSIVVTLATMVAWREGLRWLRQGQFVNLPDGAQWLGMSQWGGQTALIGLGLLVFLAILYVCARIAGGRYIYAVGSDAEAARLTGIPASRVTFLTFVLLGTLTGFAAWMGALQSPQVDPKAGAGLELKAIAACVVGGVAVSGGRGNLWGVLVGLLLLVCVNPALTHLRVEAHWEKAIQGSVILLAVLADGWRSRRR
ncbi:MAG: ABC transporter permease [Verrucomicrobia bacterium]|nr:ABC transporter permease [Verrucomicrobiota bacterium]MBI3871137.1 ABC transporter permease [Verrucomicrobiota bacterium]